MWRPKPRLPSLAALALGMVLPPAVALADAGDVHRVTGQKVNLRSGPSDDANIRGTVERGDRLVELRREGDWIGVRSENTGAEGWIYGELLELATQSSLDTGKAPSRTAGFESYSKDFDAMLAQIGDRMGGRLFDKVERTGDSGLRLTASPSFLEEGDEGEHLLAALAVQQMWKNHQNGRPVSVSVIGSDGRRLLTLDETAQNGPMVDVDGARSASR